MTAPYRHDQEELVLRASPVWPDSSISEARRLLIDDVMVRYGRLSHTESALPRRRIEVGEVLRHGRPMSAVGGNRVTVRPLVDAFGEDAVRLGMLFTAPPRQVFEWSERCVMSAADWLNRFRDLAERQAMCADTARACDMELTDASVELRRELHEALVDINAEFAACRFNRAVAGVMSITTRVQKCTDDSLAGRALKREMLDIALLLLMPVTPEIATELWPAIAGRPLEEASWPDIAADALVTDAVTLVVEVDGRVRGRVQIHRGVDGGKARHLAVQLENVRRHLAGRPPRKVIYIPDRLINLVVS